MRKGFRLLNDWTAKFLLVLALIFATTHLSAQQQPLLNIRDFVLFGGGPNCALPQNCGVQIGTSGLVNGGKIGSYSLVKTTGNAQLNADIRSNKVQLSNTN